MRPHSIISKYGPHEGPQYEPQLYAFIYDNLERKIVNNNQQMEWPFMCSVVHNVKVDIKEIYIQFLTGYARILCLLTLTQRKYVIVWMTSRIPDDIRWPNYFRHPHHDQKQRCSHDCRDFYTHYFEFHLSLSAPNLSVKLGEYNADHQLDRKIHLSCHLPATAIMMRWMNTSPPFVKYSRKSKHWQIVICS